MSMMVASEQNLTYKLLVVFKFSIALPSSDIQLFNGLLIFMKDEKSDIIGLEFTFSSQNELIKANFSYIANYWNEWHDPRNSFSPISFHTIEFKNNGGLTVSRLWNCGLGFRNSINISSNLWMCWRYQ